MRVVGTSNVIISAEIESENLFLNFSYCEKVVIVINNAKNKEGIRGVNNHTTPLMANINKLNIKPCS